MGYFSTAAKHQQTVFFRSLTNLCFRCLVNSSGVFIGKSVKLRESWSFVEGKELSIGFKTEVQWLVFKGVLDTDEDYNSNDVGSSPTYSTFVCFVPSFINVFKPRLDFRRLPGPVFDPPRRETAGRVTRWPCLWRNWKIDNLGVSDITRSETGLQFSYLFGSKLHQALPYRPKWLSK